MSYGYLGDTSTKIKQQKKNEGIFTPSEALDLDVLGHLGGAIELIQSQTVSSVSSVNFTNIKGAKYDVHLLTFFNSLNSAGGQTQMRFSNDGGSSFESSNYEYAVQSGDAVGNFNEFKSTSGSYIDWIAGNGGSDANELHNAYIYLYNLNDSAKYSFATYHSMSMDTTPEGFMTYGSAVYKVTETIDAVQIFPNSGNVSCTANLYGIKQT